MTNEKIQALKATAEKCTSMLASVDTNMAYANFIGLVEPEIILSLLAEREADKALIAEQAKRIAELEARTLTVKLPNYSEFAIVHFTGCSDDYAKGWVDGKNTVDKAYSTACASAGITLKVGGEDAQG